MSTAQTTKTTLESLATCLDQIGQFRAELNASVDSIFAFQQTLNSDLRERCAQMMAVNMKLLEQLQAARHRPSEAFVLSVDPVLGVDIHFSTEVLAQIAKDMAPGMQHFAQQMEALLQQRMSVAVRPKSPKKKPAATKASKSAKTKKAQ